MRVRSWLTLVVFASLWYPAVVSAGPHGSDERDDHRGRNGEAVFEGPGARSTPRLVRFDLGPEVGALLAWTDTRAGQDATALYVRTLTESGEVAPGWPAAGLRLGPAGENANPTFLNAPAMCWNEGTRIRHQGFGYDGRLLDGADPEGRILISNIGGPSGDLRAFDAGRWGDGIAIAWNDVDDEVRVERMKMQLFYPDGSVWPTTPESKTLFAIPPGAITSMSLMGMGSSFEYLTYIQRLDYLPGQPSSATVRGYSTFDFFIAGAVDLNERYARASIPSVRTHSSTPFQRYLQLPDGTLNRIGGISLLEFPIEPAIHLPGVLASDGAGLYAVEAQAERLVVRRMGLDGKAPAGWPMDGVELSLRADPKVEVQCASVLEGGVMIAWVDARHHDLRMTMITPEGRIGSGWSGGGNVVAEPRREIREFTLLPMGPSGAWVAWTDERDGHSEVFTQAVRVRGESARFDHENHATGTSPDADGLQQVGTAQPLNLRHAAAASTGATLHFEGWLPGSKPAVIEVLDLAGRRVASSAVASRSGAFSQSLDIKGLSRGLYWARLTQGSQQVVLRVVRLD